jgi:hypothetical protein
LLELGTRFISFAESTLIERAYKLDKPPDGFGCAAGWEWPTARRARHGSLQEIARIAAMRLFLDENDGIAILNAVNRDSAKRRVFRHGD